MLDDVTSELDRENIGRLLQVLQSFGQVFLTATNLDIPEASIVDVSINHATRRK